MKLGIVFYLHTPYFLSSYRFVDIGHKEPIIDENLTEQKWQQSYKEISNHFFTTLEKWQKFWPEENLIFSPTESFLSQLNNWDKENFHRFQKLAKFQAYDPFQNFIGRLLTTPQNPLETLNESHSFLLHGPYLMFGSYILKATTRKIILTQTIPEIPPHIPYWVEGNILIQHSPLAKSFLQKLYLIDSNPFVLAKEFLDALQTLQHDVAEHHIMLMFIPVFEIGLPCLKKILSFMETLLLDKNKITASTLTTNFQEFTSTKQPILEFLHQPFESYINNNLQRDIIEHLQKIYPAIKNEHPQYLPLWENLATALTLISLEVRYFTNENYFDPVFDPYEQYLHIKNILTHIQTKVL